MRSEDGKHFENVAGLTDRDHLTGEEFVANVFNCDKPMVAGDNVDVHGKVFQYHGEDSLGRSIFTESGQPLAPFRRE